MQIVTGKKNKVCTEVRSFKKEWLINQRKTKYLKSGWHMTFRIKCGNWFVQFEAPSPPDQNTHKLMSIYRPVSFVFARARAPRHFLLGKWHPMRKLQISTVSILRAPGQWQGGIEATASALRQPPPHCLHEVHCFKTSIHTQTFVKFHKHWEHFARIVF